MEITADTLQRAGLGGLDARISRIDADTTALQGKESALFDATAAARAREKAAIEARSTELTPKLEEAANLKAPDATLKQERSPAYQRPTLDPQDLRETFGMLTAVSMLVGAMSRTPFHNTMAAMTGAMEGFVKGDEARVKESLLAFDRNSTAIRERNAAAKAEYDAAWGKYKNDAGALQQQIKLIAAKYDDQILLAQVDRQSAGDTLKYIEQRIKQNDQLAGRLETTKANAEMKLQQMEQTKALREQTLELQRQRLAQSAAPAGGIDPKTVDFYAAQSIAGDNSWQVGLARGKVGQALIAAVKDRIPQMAAELGLSPQDVGTNKAANVALSRTIADRQKFLGAAGQFVRNFESQIDLVEKYTDKGAANLNAALNKWIQNGRKALSNDPEDVVKLDVAIRGAAREHQRIVTGVTSNAQLHVAAQETADQLLNIAQTPQAIRAALSVMREEAHNAVKSGQQEVDQLKTQMRGLGRRQGEAGGSAAPAPVNGKGWRLHTDAQGNKAYVGPNNEIEEVR